MQEIRSATTDQNARAGLKRRVILAAACSVAALPIAFYGTTTKRTSPTRGPSSDLTAMIAEYELAVKERDQISGHLDMLYDHAPSVLVSVSEVMSNPDDYYLPFREDRWGTLPDLECAFNRYSHPLIYINETAGKRILDDGDRAKELMLRRLHWYQQWRLEYGVATLEDRDMQLWTRQRVLRGRICDFSCRGIADAITKVRFAKIYLHDIDSDYSKELADIVRSMAPLAAIDDQVTALRSMSEAMHVSPT